MNQPFEPIDCVPTTARPASRRGSRQVAVRWGGRVLVIGFASGSIPKLPANLLLVRAL